MAFRSTITNCLSSTVPKSVPLWPEWRPQGSNSRGAVFTRREVVEFILDLAGYTADKSLRRARILEPSMGHGDFLLPAIDRLFESYRREVGDRGDIVEDLGDCLLAVELHRASYEETRALSRRMLQKKGVTAAQSRALVRAMAEAGRFPAAAARTGIHTRYRQPALCAAGADPRCADGRIPAALQHDL